MHEKKTEPNNQLKSDSLCIFQNHIESHAAKYLHSFIVENSPTLEIANTIASEMRRESVEKATEMFGPSLAVLHAKNLPFSSFKAHLKGIFFSQIFSLWEKYIENRCMALIKQSRIISLAMKTNDFHFETLDGDPHNLLQKPAKILIQKNDGSSQRLVLKPINAFPYKLIHKSSEIATSTLGIASLAEKIISENQDGYIRSFVDFHPEQNIENPNDYFYSFGAMCSLSSLFEVTDLHFENIIATNSGPKFIDIELILNKVSQGGAKWGYVESGLFQHHTSPIAQIKKHNHISPSIKICNGRLIFDTTEFKSGKSHLIRKNSNLLVNPMEHIKDIQRGALDTDEVLRCNLNEIRNFILTQRHGRIRALIRNTAYYKILQIQLWLPSVSLNHNIESIKNKLLQKGGLNGKFDKSTRELIVNLEIEDLCRGDIPYFWVDCASGDLMHSSRVVKKNYVLNVQGLFEEKLKKWSDRKSGRNITPVMKRLFDARK